MFCSSKLKVAPPDSRYTVAICFQIGSLYAIYEPLGAATGLSLADLNAGVGYIYLCQGIFTIFTQPLALAIGKRPTYIISCLASSTYVFWLTHVKSNGEWIGACLVFGFMSSILFVLPELSISDVVSPGCHLTAWYAETSSSTMSARCRWVSGWLRSTAVHSWHPL